MKKRILSLFTAALMAASLLAFTPIVSAAYSEDTNTYTSGSWEYRFVEDDTVGIYLYTGSDAEVTVPDELDGYKVTEIDEYAFADCESLKSVTIPDSVTTIGEGAFYGCSSLIDITIPDSVTSIESGMFYCCESLADITIPDGVTTIGQSAFYGCKSLKSIVIPEGVTTLSNAAFSQCTSLEDVTIPDSVTKILVDVFTGTPFLNNQTTTVKYAGKFAIDCDEDAETAVIYDDTEVISCSAFSSCTNLQSVSIPDSVTEICSFAFFDCESLEDITIPDNVTSIETGAFCNCTSLESVTIPEGVTSIGNIAFYNCENIKSVIIPKSVTEIGDAALGYINSEDGTDNEKVEGLTIYCFSDTAGESYATENGLDYVLLDKLPSAAFVINSLNDMKEDIYASVDGEEAETIIYDNTVYFTDLADGTYNITFSADYCTPRTYTVTVKDGVFDEDLSVSLNRIGDVTGDGRIDIKDMSKVYKHINETAPLEGYEKEIADVNSDGMVNIKDYSMIYKYINRGIA